VTRVPDDRPPTRGRQADLEAVVRLDAARTVLDAVLIGRWLADPAVIDNVGKLVTNAARWARIADDERRAA
jgi:hypothetical protein